MLTPEQILADLKTDRVKKVILDSDMYAEVDDQYALAYCMGCDKIDLLSVSAAHFDDPGRFSDIKDAMEMGYKEIFRVYDACGIPHDRYPAFKGAPNSIEKSGVIAPQDSPAAQNIIKTVKESDEIVYVLVTGPCTAVVSAYLMDPSIADNMCVLWLGAHCFDIPNCYVRECNLDGDYIAGKLLFNLDIPLLLIPCHGNGSINVVMKADDFMAIEGDSDGAKLYREIYPLQCTTKEKLSTFEKIMCDLEAPAIISMPDCVNLSIVTVPAISDTYRYIWDSTRRKILYADCPNNERIIKDAIKSINNMLNNERN